MSTLLSYFQRVDQKKLSTTSADDQSVRQAANVTPKNDEKTPKKKLSTKKESTNLSDIYSADSPKSEKRKKSGDSNDNDHEEIEQKPKSRSSKKTEDFGR